MGLCVFLYHKKLVHDEAEDGGCAADEKRFDVGITFDVSPGKKSAGRCYGADNHEDEGAFAAHLELGIISSEDGNEERCGRNGAEDFPDFDDGSGIPGDDCGDDGSANEADARFGRG